MGFFFPVPHTDYAERGLAGIPSKDASASSFAVIAGTTVPRHLANTILSETGLWHN